MTHHLIESRIHALLSSDPLGKSLSKRRTPHVPGIIVSRRILFTFKLPTALPIVVNSFLADIRFHALAVLAADLAALVHEKLAADALKRANLLSRRRRRRR